jgi:hypothetical protein
MKNLYKVVDNVTYTFANEAEVGVLGEVVVRRGQGRPKLYATFKERATVESCAESYS